MLAQDRSQLGQTHGSLAYEIIVDEILVPCFKFHRGVFGTDLERKGLIPFWYLASFIASFCSMLLLTDRQHYVGILNLSWHLPSLRKSRGRKGMRRPSLVPLESLFDQ